MCVCVGVCVCVLKKQKQKRGLEGCTMYHTLRTRDPEYEQPINVNTYTLPLQTVLMGKWDLDNSVLVLCVFDFHVLNNSHSLMLSLLGHDNGVAPPQQWLSAAECSVVCGNIFENW